MIKKFFFQNVFEILSRSIAINLPSITAIIDSTFVETYSRYDEEGSEYFDYKEKNGFKLHTLIDYFTRLPLLQFATPGARSDIRWGANLIRAAPDWWRISELTADKAYDGMDFVKDIAIKFPGIKIAIPMRRHKKNDSWFNRFMKFWERTHDTALYKKRSGIERYFSRKKEVFNLGEERTRGLENFEANCYMTSIIEILEWSAKLEIWVQLFTMLKNQAKTNLAAKPPSTDIDVINQHTGEKWYYSDIVKDHFFKPRNLLWERPKNEDEYDAHGMVGSPACGDMMEMWMKVGDSPSGGVGNISANQEIKVKELKWKTFGCASAIAATSMFSVMVTEHGGMALAEALKVRPQDVMVRLGGLPNRKIHCSVLADKAFRKTANDYFRKTGQFDRIVVEGARVIDARLNITDKDIEEAVLEGARTLEEVQKKLKVAVGASEEVKTEVEQLIRFYSEKYYG